MFYYRIYGVIMKTDLRFPQLLVETDFSEQDSNFEQHIDIIEVCQGIVPDRLKTVEECCTRIEAKDSYFSNKYCYFHINEGKKIVYERKPECVETKLQSFILGWGLAILFHQRGKISIHCSCLANEKGAVLISGGSGSGKSTLSRALLEKGYTLMADDVAVLDLNGKDETGRDVAMAYPAFPFQKLCAEEMRARGIATEGLIHVDEERDKYLVPYSKEFSPEPVPLRTVIYLGKSDGDSIVSYELTGGEKFTECMRGLFLMPLFRDKLYSTENGMRGLRFASLAPMYKIIRPREKDTREEIINTALKLL